MTILLSVKKQRHPPRPDHPVRLGRQLTSPLHLDDPANIAEHCFAEEPFFSFVLVAQRKRGPHSSRHPCDCPSDGLKQARVWNRATPAGGRRRRREVGRRGYDGCQGQAAADGLQLGSLDIREGRLVSRGPLRQGKRRTLHGKLSFQRHLGGWTIQPHPGVNNFRDALAHRQTLPRDIAPRTALELDGRLWRLRNEREDVTVQITGGTPYSLTSSTSRTSFNPRHFSMWTRDPHRTEIRGRPHPSRQVRDNSLVP
jgi:hypothetical protein